MDIRVNSSAMLVWTDALGATHTVPCALGWQGSPARPCADKQAPPLDSIRPSRIDLRFMVSDLCDLRFPCGETMLGNDVMEARDLLCWLSLFCNEHSIGSERTHRLLPRARFSTLSSLGTLSYQPATRVIVSTLRPLRSLRTLPALVHRLPLNSLLPFLESFLIH